jgi:hypothetical protein
MQFSMWERLKIHALYYVELQVLYDWIVDGWRVVDDDDYRQAVGEPQAKGMMSTSASFSLS